MNMLEGQSNSLERVDAYLQIEQEPKPNDPGKPPAYWPTSGDLRVDNLCARYSLDGPEVLHNLSFHIRSGEWIGVGECGLELSLFLLDDLLHPSGTNRIGKGEAKALAGRLYC